jgi:shikimate dehydrogenase
MNILTTAKWGLIGHNIQYSLSPAIHNYSAKILGKNPCYEIIDLNLSDLDIFINYINTNTNLLGYNVTTPYKSYYKLLQLNSQGIFAVNTIYKQKNSWSAASTDVQGFAKALLRKNFELCEFKKIIVLGCGGFVLSLLEHLQEHQYKKEIFIVRRSNKKDIEIKNNFGRLDLAFVDIEASINLKKILQSSSQDILCIQATNAPQQGDDLKYLIENFMSFKGVFFDLLYAKPSSIYRFCKQDNSKTSLTGLSMLIEQALLAQNIWWGEQAPYEKILNLVQPLAS